MARKPKRRVGAKRACNRWHKLSEDTRGAVVCTDACGQPAPLENCTGFTMPPGSEKFHVRFKKSCRMDGGLKERMEQRVTGAGTKYEFIDE